MNDEPNDGVVGKAWEGIETWLSKEHPSGAELLAPGATDVLLERLSASIGAQLPPGLAALLAVHDGQKPMSDWFVHSCAFDCGGGTFKLLSIREMLDERRRRDGWEISDEQNTALAGHAAGVKRAFWNRGGWLPLATGDEDDCFFVDLDPASDGVFGQVVAWYRADGAALVVAASVAVWLARLADCMASGNMDVDEDGVHHRDE